MCKQSYDAVGMGFCSILKKCFLLWFLLCCFCMLVTAKPVNAAEAVKIQYNGTTYRNTSEKLPVCLDGKTISKKKYKAVKIGNTYMVPYTDIFKTGLKFTCKKKNKTITMTGNNITLKMKVGSKRATLNGKKVTLPIAPLSVKYISQNTTKILVPVKFITQSMGFTFYRSASAIQIFSPLSLKYDEKEVSYHDVQGTLYYNHNEYELSSLPVIKLNKKYYIPAEEVLGKILGLEYSYLSDTGKITIENEDLDILITANTGSKEMTVNDKKVSLGAPVRIIRDIAKKQDVVCVPAASVLKQLGYTRKWDSSANQYTVQSKSFFMWEKALTAEQTANTSVNYIYKALSSFSESNGLGTVKIQLTGSSADLMNSLTVKRENSVITITMPSSQYILEKNNFSNFGEIVDKIEVVSETDNSVAIALTCKETSDYSYTVQNGVLELNILYTYKESNSDNTTTNYSLSIPKPEGITEANVTNEDLYPNSKAFKVLIKGDYVKYFKANPVIINNNTVKRVTVSKSGSNTVIKVKTSKLRGYKIYVKKSAIIVKMGAPKKIYKSIVVLDSGHGGFDPGAQNKGTNEKDLNLKIMYTRMKTYFSDNAPDIKVYWTRTKDTFVTLANRAAFAKKVSADVFISLHMNSADNTSANGTEVYYSVSNNSKSFSGITSKIMAAAFKNRLIDDLNTKNRGTKTAAYYVLKHNTVPSILIELGFISGNADYSKLTNASFQKKAAKSIYSSIVSLFNKYPTGR